MAASMDRAGGTGAPAGEEMQGLRLSQVWRKEGQKMAASMDRAGGQVHLRGEEMQGLWFSQVRRKDCNGASNQDFYYFLGRGISRKAIEHSLCEFDKFYRAVIEKTSKRKYTVEGGVTTTEHLSCALCRDKSLFCVVEDIWWLCARCTALECNNLGSISKIKLKKVSVEVKKIKANTI